MANLDELRTNAQQGVTDVANLEQSVPGLLAGLKQNLTSIFSKDNPLIQQRESLLSNYLSTPERTAASLLPSNMPTVAGSPLNLSPTQQSAIDASRSAAAFAPLASLNNLIVGQYGNIGDILSNAAALYQGQVEAAKTRSTGFLDLYKQAIAEEKNRQDAATSVGIQGDIASIIAALQQGQTGGQKNVDDFLDSLVEPDPFDTLRQNMITRLQSPPALPQPSLDLGGRQPATSAQLRLTL